MELITSASLYIGKMCELSENQITFAKGTYLRSIIKTKKKYKT